MRETGEQFWNDKGPRLSSGTLAFTLHALSLSPLLVVVIRHRASAAFGEQAARGEISNQIESMAGEEGAQAIQSMLAKTRTRGTNTLMTIVGVATLLFGASGVFAELQSALDTVWKVRPEQSRGGIVGAIRDRILSFSVVCGLAFLLLVSLAFSASLRRLDGWLEARLPNGGWSLRVGNQVVSFLLTMALFGFIFKVLPHARPAWSDVWHGGALFTAGLFTLGKYPHRALPGSGRPWVSSRRRRDPSWSSLYGSITPLRSCC